MPILAVLVLVMLLAVVFGPQWWIGRVLRQHGGARPDFPGTGGELARHLLDEAGFGKALPALTCGRYLAPADLPAARSVLRAAAWTYVAGALATLLNAARLFRAFRF
jgi:Zn-dependent membrane protease YugP